MVILNLFVLVALAEDLSVSFMSVVMETVRVVSEENHNSSLCSYTLSQHELSSFNRYTDL